MISQGMSVNLDTKKRLINGIGPIGLVVLGIAYGEQRITVQNLEKEAQEQRVINVQLIETQAAMQATAEATKDRLSRVDKRLETQSILLQQILINTGPKVSR